MTPVEWILWWDGFQWGIPVGFALVVIVFRYFWFARKD